MIVKKLLKAVKLTLVLFLLLPLWGSAQDSLPHRLHIAWLTDLHVSPGIPAAINLEQIVKEINAAGFDLVMVTGDITNTGSDAELRTAHEILGHLNIPAYILPGNHETNWSESAGKTWQHLWKNDRFSLVRFPYLFLGFNTGPYMKMGDGHVKKEDLVWIREELARQYQPGMKVVVLSHYPLGEGLDNWPELVNLLRPYPTLMALCGHGHRLSLHNFDGIPGIMGRSALAGKQFGAGYNILAITPDSVFVAEKQTGLAPKPFIAFSHRDPSPLLAKKSSSYPDYTINDRAGAHRYQYHYADSASIFTAPRPVGADKVAFSTSDGKTKVLTVSSGQVTEIHNSGNSIYSNPIRYGNSVITGDTEGNLLSWNLATNRRDWMVALDGPIMAEGVIDQNRLYVSAGSGTMYCIDARNGKIIWAYRGIEGMIQGRPAVQNKRLVFGAWDTHLYCLDTRRGKLRWKWNNGNHQKLYSPANIAPAISNGKVFIVAPDRYMTAIDLRTGRTIWRNNHHRVRESMGMSENGKTIYAKLMNDTIIAVSATARVFELQWSVDAGFGYEHNPCPIKVSGGVVYAGTKNGVLIAIDESGQKKLWQYKAGNSAVNGIEPDSEGNIWISLMEGKLFRFKPLNLTQPYQN